MQETRLPGGSRLANGFLGSQEECNATTRTRSMASSDSSSTLVSARSVGGQPSGSMSVSNPDSSSPRGRASPRRRRRSLSSRTAGSGRSQRRQSSSPAQAPWRTKALASAGGLPRSSSWLCSSAVTSGRAIAFTPTQWSAWATSYVCIPREAIIWARRSGRLLPDECVRRARGRDRRRACRSLGTGWAWRAARRFGEDERGRAPKADEAMAEKESGRG